MATDFVFVGPSLPATEAAALLPGATVLPPVRHGDLLRLNPRPGDRVLIIDGLFLQSAPVRHKEILRLLERGVIVAGSSSMGALRAAELWPFGMRGIGEVFTLYRDGVITGDDEVAVIHTSGDDGFHALSEPLVSMRVAIAEAAEHGAVTAGVADELLRIARSLPFRSRSLRMLEQVALTHVPDEAVASFAAWRREHARDLKAEDARTMLRLAAADDAALQPHGGADWPITSTRNMHLRSWAYHFQGEIVDDAFVSDADALAAIMLFHPAYPAAHRHDVLARVAGSAPSGADVERAAVRQARLRGLALDALPHDSWLTRRERESLDEDEALARLLVRAFGASGERPSDFVAGRFADDADAFAWARSIVVDAEQANRFVPARAALAGPAVRLRFRDDVVERTIAAYWGCEIDDLPALAGDRGIGSMPSLVRLAEPFTAYLKIGDRSGLAAVA